MITIVFAPPRTGKTCFITHKACEIAFDRERTRAMQNELKDKIANGFDGIRTIPTHCVASNYDITMRKFGYRPRLSRRVNPYRLGFSNPFVDTHFSVPFECYFITEAQKYFNSRMSMYYPDWQSRFFEQGGHDNLDFWLDTQRPHLIDLNIRELARFIEIMRLEKRYDDFGRVCRLKWDIRLIDNSSLFDLYILSGKKDKSCFIEDTVIADYNVFDCYNSQLCKPKFYDGHLHDDFDYVQGQPTDETLDGYIQFLQRYDDELPDKFYKARKIA